MTQQSQPWTSTQGKTTIQKETCTPMFSSDLEYYSGSLSEFYPQSFTIPVTLCTLETNCKGIAPLHVLSPRHTFMNGLNSPLLE